ncbi:hypothetical protein QT711_14505 [Sporosarcina saromensis]|uniref:Lipoprotein n=1 Tax=Sporosarcina saromensis TaxID=359365 RepID=A0ABU4GBP1_9BACL|nr:hypothetical protein [Sporosarcina saromensis]MDW0114406.1 hypothetical protein [Sporosarcina saromensis]
MVKKLLGIFAIIGFFAACSNEVNQTNNNLEEEVEKEILENDKNQSNLKDDVVELDETSMEIHTGSTETISRKTEGQDQEINVINYHITPYGIAYQLDEVFGVPEVVNNQIYYTSQNSGYKITLEIIEHTNLEKAVSNLQERFESEGYEESFEDGYELKSTPVEENGLIGKTQLYGDHPMKGFVAYEIDEHALVVTFQYQVEGADAMNPLLEDLRKSIHMQ